MKKIIAVLVALVLLCSAVTGCSVVQNMKERTDTMLTLSGEWSSDWEDLSIMGNIVEITGHYELDGRRMPGVVTMARITVQNDGHFKLKSGSQVLEGYVVDEDTLMIEGTEYTR